MTIGGAKAKWLVAGGIVSLGINLLLIGWIAGGRMHGPGFGLDRQHFGGGPMAMMGSMPDELRPMMKEKFEAHREAFEAFRAEMEQARKALADVLEAEPFDPNAYDQALGALKDIRKKMMDLRLLGLTELAAEMTPEQRRQWAEGLRAWKGRHWRE